MMNTAALKKASYASRQHRGGPAPLASFEDLPSDEMESPSSLAGNVTSDSESLNDSTTPGTVLCSPVSALRLDVQDTDALSQHTLTPCLSLDGITDNATTRSVTPSFQIEEPRGSLSVSVESGSALYLSVQEDKSPVENRRKSSWTDLFHRPRSRSRSPQSSPQPPRKLSGQERSDVPTDDPSKKKKGILSSIFKFHDKKSSTSTKAESHVKSPTEPGEGSVQSPKTVSKTPEKVFTLGSPPPPPSRPPVEVALRPSVEVSIAVTELQVTKHKAVRATHQEAVPMSVLADFSNEMYNAKTDDDNNSSESDLATEIPSEKEEVDFEAETLLAQDSVEYDEFLALEGSAEFLPSESQAQQQQKPRRQRLEITTVPIDRPRSTTPISVAPLEAFIQSSLHTPSPEVEKLRVLLPCDTFLARPKSPKKSHPKSWQDFCHAGLHSPRLPKRNDDDENTTPDEECHRKDSWTPSKESWETFEVSHDEDEITKEIKLSTSSSFSSSCDSNSAGMFNKENTFPESYSSFHSNEKLHICTDTNFASQELNRLNEPSDKSPL